MEGETGCKGEKTSPEATAKRTAAIHTKSLFLDFSLPVSMPCMLFH